MPGSFTFSPGPIPVARDSDQVHVYRYFDKADSFDQKYEFLDHVLCLGISTQEGANPGTARFRYKTPLDEDLSSDVPVRVEDSFPLDATGPLVINGDDRLVVRRVTADGADTYLFDGFVQAPSADLNADGEVVSFVALGAPVREWDTPLAGALVRDADVPGADVNRQTDLPAQFNPDGKPNASPDGKDSGTDPARYPAFLGPFWPTNLINGAAVRMWSLAMAARYIIVRGTMQLKDDGSDDKPSKYVTFGDLTYLDDLLTAWAPAAAGETEAYQNWLTVLSDPASTGQDVEAAQEIYDALWGSNDTGVIDAADEASFTAEAVEAPDLTVTGMAWPAALERLIQPYGFSFRFELSESEPEDDEDGNPGEWPDGQFGDPVWKLKMYWKEGGRPGKTLTLQKAGGTLDPGKTNVGELSLVRDSSGIANRVVIDAAVVRVEAPLVLAPLFKIDPADADTPGQFKRTNFGDDEEGDPAEKTTDKYRLYGFDECGEGHWDFKSFTWFDNTMPNIRGDLGPAFKSLAPKAYQDRTGSAARFWSTRRRPTFTKMNSVDVDGKPLQATIYFSNDYAGDMPGVWDGTGTWQALTTGEWRALDDRLGFYITAADPNAWAVGKMEPPIIDQIGGGAVENVKWTATPTLTNKYPRYMILCTFDADNDFDVVAGKRKSSTTGFTVTRRVDARDRFQKTLVSKWSFFQDLNADTYGSEDTAVTDDQADAQALADAERRHSENCVFAGTATVPRLTLAYTLGDKITAIDGRNMSLRTNLGAEQSESPVYPSVVGIAWNFDGGQSTVLTLNDERQPPPPRRGRRRDE